MDRRLLQYYEVELRHLRQSAWEFAQENPKRAGRLALSENECADPYVERLLEGFAYLAGRVHLKLDAEFPRFTQSLLGTIYPHYLAPTPSMMMARFEPDYEGDLAEGFEIPRLTTLRSLLGEGGQTHCEYRTAHAVQLWPLRVVEAQYHVQNLAMLEAPAGTGAKAAIRIRLECLGDPTFNKLRIEDLVFHVGGDADVSMRLYEQLIGHCVGGLVQPPRRPMAWQERLSGRCVGRVGFNRDEALLPYDARSFQGYRLLHEYFAFPRRFMFVRIGELGKALARCDGRHLDVSILLDQADLTLERLVRAENFQLFCTPAVNLFPKRTDRIRLADRFSEFHVVPDRTRPMDYEVYQIRGVTGHGIRADEEQQFRPFYSATDLDTRTGAYYMVHREPRQVSQRELRVGRRSDYAGSEVFLSLVDAEAAPFRSDLRQLSVTTLCTNRDLPIHLSVGAGATDFTMTMQAPVNAIRCVGRPTAPRAATVEGELAWRAISHLTLNYLSLIDTDQKSGAEALRDILRIYADLTGLQGRKEIDGVKSMANRAIIRRIPTDGPISFGRGVELAVTLDENAFEGHGMFLFGGVLERFFAKYVATNSFTETVVRTVQRGEIMRWAPSIGTRQIL